MDKNELRDRLFERYFECNDGVLITELMELSKPMVELYSQLKKILVEHKTIKLFSNINQVKLINYNNKDYLFFKRSTGLGYLIIDIELNKTLNPEEVRNIFNEEIFIKEFNEESTGLKEEWTDLYHFLKYEGDVKSLIEFYNENKNMFDINTIIFNRLYVGEAWTWLWISLTSGQIQLSFQTEDQFLYECLFLNSDLTPSPMQDATEKMGKEKMLEIFERIKEIRIPNELIPTELLNSSDAKKMDNYKINQKVKVLK